MLVKCPTCSTKVNWENNPYRPFCSERCKLIDLGKWLRGDYSIPVMEDDNSPEEKEDSD
ncbi:MAG: DNA gyrase inhibitor YacG [Proteobacteria bacterium]|nr:DNA gyrase inhibitor YacG [Pseudomonadota bacterium]